MCQIDRTRFPLNPETAPIKLGHSITKNRTDVLNRIKMASQLVAQLQGVQKSHPQSQHALAALFSATVPYGDQTADSHTRKYTTSRKRDARWTLYTAE